jgi:hypothetical protein
VRVNVAPSSPFETAIDWGETGLDGTIRVRLLDGDGGTAIAPTTVGIDEFPASSGRYEVTLTAPGTAGQYFVFWDDGAVGDGHSAPGDDILVTGDIEAVGSSSNLYVTRTELKVLLKIANETYSDERIDIAVAAASRAIDGYKGTRYYPTTETRYYSPGVYDREINLGDIASISAIAVDRDLDGTYTEEWVNGTDFWLDPPNALADGRPYTTLVLRDQARRRFTRYQRGLRITGSFGWAATPALVKQAAVLIANRLLHRTSSAPLGILVASASEAVATARLGQIDPDAAWLLDQLDPQPELVSLQLG